MLIYSKKLVSGKPSVQTFQFFPLNAQGEATESPTAGDGAKVEEVVEDKSIDAGKAIATLVNEIEKINQTLKKQSKQMTSIKKQLNARV